MESLTAFLVIMLALLAIFVLYLFGTAVALRFFGRLSSARTAALDDTDASRSAV